MFDAEGRLRACVQEEWGYEPSEYPGDLVAGYHFDPEKFWSLLGRSARAALERASVEPATVAGVAATSQREGSVFLDASGRELLATPNFDSRGFLEGVDVLDRLGGPDRLYRLTGHSPPFIFPLSRLLWWRKRFPERPVATSLMISDWVTYRLTGERVAEPTNAVESLFFDVTARDWSEEILSAFEVPRSLLPRLLPSGAPAGSVTREAASATGLLEGTPVFTGGADTQCALLGAGVVSADEAGAVLGTTGPVQRVVAEPVFDDARHLWLGPHVVPGLWVLESNGGDFGKSYVWLLELLGAKPTTAGDYARLDREAAGASPDVPVFAFVGPAVFDLRNLNPGRAAGLLFPYPFGRRLPKRAEVIAGFLESVAYSVRANLEQIEEASGRRIERLSLGGGLSKSALLVRLVSQVTAITIQVSEVAETAALGCALLAGVGAGLYPDLASAVSRAVRSNELPPVDPGPYPERYRKWRALFATLNGTTVP